MGLFKKSKPSMTSTNPYLSGQRVWNDVYGTILKSAQNDRFISKVCIIMAAGALIGMYILNSRVKWVPYVVVMDSKKEVIGTVLPQGVNPDERFFRYDLVNFVISWRSIIGDRVVFKTNMRKVFARVEKGSQAFNVLFEYLNDQDNPIDTRLTRERVKVEVIAVLPISKSSWQIDWKETKTDVKEGDKSVAEYRGIFKVAFHEVKSESNIPINPLGMVISEISVDKIQSGNK